MIGWLIGGTILLVLPIVIVSRQLRKASVTIDTVVKEELPPPQTWSVEQAETLLMLLDHWEGRGIPEQQQADWLYAMFTKQELPPATKVEDIAPAAMRKLAEEILQKCT
jgi:hypothetical protein